MAQSFQTSDVSLIIPSAAATISVVSQPTGLAANGILMLVGEADQGGAFSQESDVTYASVTFGPGDTAQVVGKYGSGPLVDAFMAAAQASNDVNIQGSANAIILMKTNVGVQASLALPKVGGGTYASLFAKTIGLAGSSLAAKISAASSEVAPATGAFTWINNVSGINAAVRVNGGASQALTLSADISPTTFVSDINGLSGVSASGGADRLVIQAIAGNLSVGSIVGNSAVFTISTSWAVVPSVGDSIVISNTSAIKGPDVGGGHFANVGAYVVIAATASTIQATKLSDAGATGAVAGTITPPQTVAPAAVASTTADLQGFSPVSIVVIAGTVLSGVGKSLELADLGSGADRLVRYAFQLNTTPVVWVSVSGAPQLLKSSVEYSVDLNMARSSDNLSEDLSAGGAPAMLVSYQGTTATLSISASAITTSVTGGSGANLNIPIAQFSTIKDLCVFISTQTGYAAAPATSVIGQQSPAILDQVSAAGIASAWGALNGRIKMDAQALFNVISNQSISVQLGNPPARAASGLPDVLSQSFLSGGARGGSSTAQFLAAIDALQGVVGNFLVPCISQNAAIANGFGSTDIALGLTDSSSTYVAQTVMAYVNTHCLAMSKAKKRKNRQGFLSIRDTFVNAKNAAGNIASFRCSMDFQDVKRVNTSGVLTQSQPWMGAVMAASMQAAGIYRLIVRKFINIQGAIQAAGDYSDQDDNATEQALQSGLLPIRRSHTGGWYWVSDQTTYSKDSNPIYNSIQAVYVADIVAVDLAQSMEDAFVGASVADVSASGALTFLESKMAEYRRLKFIAASSDAPLGFKNAKIQLALPAMLVSVEIKEATGLYFIPINILVSTVTQSAAQ